jgi:hypothetical protein
MTSTTTDVTVSVARATPAPFNHGQFSIDIRFMIEATIVDSKWIAAPTASPG